MPLLVAVFVAGQVATSPVQAATLGHSRLVSAVGEPLRITIPVTQISESQLKSLRVVPAPVSEWSRAGLTPPVDLATLQTRLSDGYVPGAYVLQVWSDTVFNQPIADLLLDIHTSSGVQRYQVSLLARGGTTAIQAPSGQSTTAVSGTKPALHSFDQRPVLVRRGDTMFAIAGRRAVAGVSVYQMMIALQRANPRAFIHDNINLVKAGEQLSMPDMAALTAISDREARRLFHEQVVAFNAYRQKLGDSLSGEVAALQAVPLDAHDDATSGDITSNVPQSRIVEGDQLRLSSGRGAFVAGSQSSVDAASDPAQPPEQDLAHTNGSVSARAQNIATGVSQTVTATASDGTTLATLSESSAQGASETGATSATATAAATNSSPRSTTVNAASPASTTDATTTTATTTTTAAGTESTSTTDTEEPASTARATASASTSDGTDSTPTTGATGPTSTSDVKAPSPTSAHDAANSASTTGAAGRAISAGTGSLAPPNGSAVLDEDAKADDALAARKAISDAEQRVSQLEANVKTLNQALQAQGEAAKDVVVDGALGLRQSLTDVATAVTDATIGDEEYLNRPKLPDSTKPDQADTALTQNDASNGSGVSNTLQDNKTISTMDSITHWLNANLIGVITGILALIVLVIAWVLRRANVSQSRAESAVTPEMVKEKLEQINLDLNEPTINDSSSSR